MKDYYKILGIEKNASDEEIKKAYRKKAHEYHPDKAHGDEAKFKEVNEAYQILSDKQKRSAYDRFGTADFGAGFPGGANMNWSDFANMGGFPGGVDLGDLGDIFETFFGGGGRRARTVTHGADLELVEEITLEEAYESAKKEIVVGTWVRCEVCKGQGGDPAAGTEQCSVCRGKGEVREERKTFFGSFAQVKTCERCGGAGHIPKKVCDNCKGKGRVGGERHTILEIIPGIQDGQLIQIKGFGEAGERGTQAGDLYVRIKIKPHPVFTRQGDNLIIRRELKVLDLLLGKEFEAPLIEGGHTKFEIPHNFDLKQPYRIPGKGMPRMHSFGRGDLLVDFIIKAPKKLSAKERKILEDLE